jgi:hypothetical protein
MKILEGKSPAERKKIILAIALGALVLLMLVYNFSGMFGGRKTTINVSVSPTPTPATSTNASRTNNQIQALNQEAINQDWLTRPVAYTPGSFYAPDAGRNIFAFYEPPPPTPYVVVEKPIKTPTPTPTPTPVPPAPLLLGYVSPQSVFAGSKTFRLEVNGDKFTPDTLIIMDGSQLPTNFVSPQKLTTDIPATLIAGEGQRTIMVRTPDGKLYSDPVQMSVQAPPRPTVEYIGVQMARRGNNNTAYFREKGKPTEFSARLNDIINGRFKMVSISVNEVIMEDTSLGFRHKLPMSRSTVAGGAGVQPSTNRGGFNDRNNTPGRFPVDGTTVQPYNPTMPQTQEIPGIPSNIPRYVPPPPPNPQQQKKQEDVDDEDGDN